MNKNDRPLDRERPSSGVGAHEFVANKSATSPFCRLGLLVATLSLLLAGHKTLAAPVLPAGFRESVAISGLLSPTAVRFARDGRIFVAEKRGVIKVFQNLSATPTIFADLRTQVYNYWDRGLLGLELHPSFPDTPYVYVLYTLDAQIGGTPPRWGTPGADSDGCPNPPGATSDGCVAAGRLSRLQAAGNVMTGSEHVLVEGWCQQFPSHSLGSLTFGPDGALYVSAGEGGSFAYPDFGQKGSPLNPCGDPPGGVGGVQTVPTARGGALRAQSLRRPAGEPAVFNGTVLRVDPISGAALPDNPLFAETRPSAARVVAYGLRNPFRLAFRPGTRELWITDVGWDTWEEIDRISDTTDNVVENFGWPCYEGPAEQASFAALGLDACNGLYGSPGSVVYPHLAYRHGQRLFPGDDCSTGSSSISALAFYPGGSYPSQYDNALFFADYSRACIWAMLPGADGAPAAAQSTSFVVDAAAPVDLQVGPGGDLFYVDFNGSVRRIGYFSTNQPPLAGIQADRTDGALPLTVHFDASSSTDPDAGDTLSFAWDLDGDGEYDDASNATPQFTYTNAGTFTVRLRLTDSHGANATAVIAITAGNTAPVVAIVSPAPGTMWEAGQAIDFEGTVSDAEDPAVPFVNRNWTILIHHCPIGCHIHPLQSFSEITRGSFFAPDHDYPSYLEIVFSVTDSGGLTSTASVNLYPRTVDLSFTSQPPGLTLSVGNSSGTTPFTRALIVSSSTTVTALSPQTMGGVAYDFAAWSDSGARSHQIVVPPAAADWLATFSDTPGATSGLIAAYSFDEGSGSIAHDSSGAGNHGTLGSPVSWTSAAKYGSAAVQFSGTSGSYVSIPHSSSLDVSDALTVEAWVRPTTTDGALRLVLAKDMQTPHPDIAWSLFGLGWDNQNKPAGSLFDDDTNNWFACSATQNLPADAWAHLAFTYDRNSGDQVLYIDGNEHRRCPQGVHKIKRTTEPLYIGGSEVKNFPFVGSIDEVRIWSYARSPQQIAVDRDSGIAALPAAATAVSSSRSPTPTPSATPRPNATRTPTHTATPTVTALAAVAGRVTCAGSTQAVGGVVVDASGPTQASSTTDALGQFSVDVPAGVWILQPRKLGDTQPGISAVDASFALQAAVGLRQLSAEQRLACDVNGDGQQTAIDATAILEKVVGAIGQLNVAARCGSDWVFIPSPAAAPNQVMMMPSISSTSCEPGRIAYAPLSARLANQDFQTVLFGDCNGSWTAAAGGGAILAQDDSTTVYLGTPRRRGHRVLIPLFADTARPFLALEVELHHDPLQLRLRAVRPHGDARAALVSFSTHRGRTLIALASTLPITPGGEPVLMLEISPLRRTNAGISVVRASIDDVAAVVEAAPQAQRRDR